MQNSWNKMLTTPSRLFSSVLSISRRSPLARRWRWKWNWRLRTSNLTFHLSRAWEILAWEAGIGNRYHFRQFLSFLPVPWVSNVFFLAPQADRSSAEYPSHETYPKPETTHEKSLGSRVSFRLIKGNKTKIVVYLKEIPWSPCQNSCPKFLNTLWCPSLNLFGSAAMSHSLIPLVKKKKPSSEKMFLPLPNIICKNWSTSSVIARVHCLLLRNPKNKKSCFSRFIAIMVVLDLSVTKLRNLQFASLETKNTCTFFFPVVQGAWVSYCGKRAADIYKVPGDEAARSHRGYW